MPRAEVRWEHVDIGGVPDDEFVNSSTSAPGFTKSDQIVEVVELVGQF